MRYEPQGLERWANTDPSLHFNRIEPRQDGPTWQSIMICCLKAGDAPSADLIFKQNMPHTDECLYGDHDLCHALWCKCLCHSAMQFALEHPGLRSSVEVASEQDEEEFEASLR